jgi:protein-histidine pros-kinase
LRALATKPVVEISKVAERVSQGQLGTPEYTSSSKDEVGSLSMSFNRMRRSLQKAMNMLEEQS